MGVRSVCVWGGGGGREGGYSTSVGTEQCREATGPEHAIRRQKEAQAGWAQT
jgi:hypothetical protein